MDTTDTYTISPEFLARLSDPDSTYMKLVTAAMETEDDGEAEANMAFDALSFAASVFTRLGLTSEIFAITCAAAWEEVAGVAEAFQTVAELMEADEAETFSYDSEGNYFDRESEVA